MKSNHKSSAEYSEELENPLLLKKRKSNCKKDPLDWHLDRPLTAEELAGFGKQKPTPRNIKPFFRLEDRGGISAVIGIKGTF